MPSESRITAQVVLAAVLELQRLGSDEALHRLEETEPDLAEYVLESLSTLHGNLLTLGGRAKQTHRVYLEAQEIILVCIAAVRSGLGTSIPGGESERPTPPTG